MTTPTRPARGATDLDIVRAALDADYEVIAEIGRGGMAVVYQARERALDRTVALKVLPFTLAHDDDLVERFQREAKTAAQLEHPHVIPIYRVGRSAQVIYFTMKLVRGLSLSDRLVAEGRLSAGETRRVLSETSSALGYAHRRGVVHRDVKPDNILLDEDGRCVVTDFGIARSAADSALTAAGSSIGTPRFMSPEQARARPVDGRSDIYSLGVVGYQCLTGRLPFDGDDMMAILLAHVSKPLPEPANLDPARRAVYDVIARMLAKSPEQRFQTAEDVIAALAHEDGAVSVRQSGAGAAGSPAEHEGMYGSIGSAPVPSAALDRALDAGFQMLKQQRPRLDAGLEAGKRVVQEQAPRVRSSADRVGAGVRGAWSRIVATAAGHPRAFWTAVVATGVLGVGLPLGLHYAIDHRSRCPAQTSGVSSPPGAGTPSASGFTLLLDEGASVRAGGDAEVYYDVCGLEDGTGFTTRIVMAKQQSGLQRLLGGSIAPLSETLDESAHGPAIRRHRTFDMDGMPAGGYTLRVVVTDAKGRRRERSTRYRVGE